MIVAHHGGEAALLSAAAVAAGSAPFVLALLRAQLRDLVERWRGRA